MKKVIYICDKCGAEISGEPFGITGLDYDFCSECFGKINKMIEVFMRPEAKPAAEPKPEPKKKAKRKTNLDLGKIAALHRAGWSNVKIADELGCSAPTIANHLKEALNFLMEHQNDYYKEEQKDE